MISGRIPLEARRQVVRVRSGCRARRPPQVAEPEHDQHQRHAELQGEPHAWRHGDPKDDGGAPPTRNTVSEWPIPQSPPIHAARRKLRSRETIVVIATTWSASVACLRPSRNPERGRRERADAGVHQGDRLRLPLQEIHQDELPERHRVREVGAPARETARDHLHEAPPAHGRARA